MLHASNQSASHGGDPSDQPVDPTDLMADPHCRHLVAFLRETDGSASIEEVSRYVVAEITDSATDEVPAAVLRRVQTWLHHGQLPELDELGVVEFDPDRGIVRFAGPVDRGWQVDRRSIDSKS